MAKVYAAMEFTARDGNTYEIGDGFDLPRETDLDKQEYDRLIDEGVVSKTEIAKPSPVSDVSETEQRSRRASKGN